MSKQRPRIDRGLCPTCGSSSWPTRAKRRRGGRTYVKARNYWTRRRRQPNTQVIRVYWPAERGSSSVGCPDPYHKRFRTHWWGRSRSERDPETPLPHVEHRPPKELDHRAKRARKHKDNQGKDRR